MHMQRRMSRIDTSIFVTGNMTTPFPFLPALLTPKSRVTNNNTHTQAGGTENFCQELNKGFMYSFSNFIIILTFRYALLSKLSAELNEVGIGS